MNFDTLRKALQGDGTGVRLTYDTLSDERFRGGFAALWGPGGAIRIPGAKPVVHEADQSITITGGAEFPQVMEPGGEAAPFGIAIAAVPCDLTAVFTLMGDGQVQAILSFSVPAGHSVQKLFPNLPAAYESEGDGGATSLPDVLPILWGEALSELRLVFSTHLLPGENPPLHAGLNLRARWTPARLTPPQGTELDLHGQLVLPDPRKPAPPLADDAMPWDEKAGEPLPPGIHLRAALREPHPLWGHGTFADPAFVFYSPLTRGGLLRNLSYRPRMAYLGTVTLGKLHGKEVRGSGALSAHTWDAFAKDVLLVCSFQDAALTSVGDVLTLAKDLLRPDTAVDVQVLPESVTVDATHAPSLERTFIRLVNNAPVAAGFTIGLGKAATWTVVEKEITAGLTKVRVVIAKGGSGVNAWATLTGQLTMWSAVLEASVEVPGFLIRARQVGDIQVKLPDIFDRQAHSGFPRLQGPSLVIKDMNLSVAPALKSYRFSLGIQGALSSQDKLPELQLTLSNDEWALHGSGGESGGGLKLGELLNELLRAIVRSQDDQGLPTSVTLPEVLQSFTLTGFMLSARRAPGSTSGKGNQYTFSCEGTFDVADKPVRAGVRIQFAQQQNTYAGWLLVGGRRFSFTVETTKGAEPSRQLVAAYSHPGSEKLGFGELLRDVLPLSEDVAKDLDVLQIDLKSAFFASIKAPQKKVLLGVDLSVGFDFSKLPLIGKGISVAYEDGAGIDDLQILYASPDFSTSEVSKLNSLLPTEITRLPEGPQPSPGAGPNPPALSRGLNIAANLNLGGAPRPLSFPTASSAGAPPANPGTPPAPGTDSATWFSVQKTLGPVHFERIGVDYRDKKLWVLFSASIRVAGLTLSLDGLSLGSPLTEFEPSFSLAGLGLDYTQPPLTLSGSLLRVLAPDVDFQFDGTVVIRAQELGIAGIGSFAQTKAGDASFFAFAQLEMPLGGPPPFFVTGLMAGFGFNRSLAIPAMDEVQRFPLLLLDKKRDDVLSILEGRTAGPGGGVPRRWITPQPGALWFAAGLTFTSFELVHSSALLVVEPGSDLTVALLGLSTMQLPLPAESSEFTYASVELQLSAVLKPEAGVFTAAALLSANSYLFTPNCRLTGGFAFYTWYGKHVHAGEFVLTLGGYHPAFGPPDHYPKVPRLGFNWPVSDNVSIKGDAYFALTPSCAMAGGGLEVLFHDGSLMAWFTAHADVLISWRPFFFSASIDVDIGIGFRLNLGACSKMITLSIGASLDLWGPPTGGVVHVHLVIFTFSVRFGSDAAHQNDEKELDWAKFRALLPASNVCSLAPGEGLVGTADSDSAANSNSKKRWFVRPRGFSFTTQSAIPASALQVDNHAPAAHAATAIPIRPMNKAALTSTHKIKVERDGEPSFKPVGWSFAPITRKMPAALWSAPPIPFKQSPAKPSSDVVNGMLVGYRVTMPEPTLGSAVGPIAFSVLNEEYLDPGQAPLSPDVERTAAYAPVASTATIGEIADMARGSALSGREELFGSLKKVGVYGGENGKVERMAERASHLFAAPPMHIVQGAP
ncbi:DUF6603 domain-containing protein [Hyalangium versicolor]|uniref:DUF6603 domain-containing protein n=1 Tax=Hyalangium versicolor TaxID=2861190 RepID=UPI001CCC7CF6|nr:DUF6603 domain-containing protein [Hyalangium versicolor]